MATSAGKVTVTAEFPHQLARRARVAAALQGTSRSELIRQAVDTFVEGLGVDRLLASVSLEEASRTHPGATR
jgi:hypothetical protein